MRRLRAVTAAVTVAAAVAIPAIAAAGVSAVGSPIRIDDGSGTPTTAVSTAMRGDGSFAVAWSTSPFGTGGGDIRVRLYAPGGIARGASFSARSATAGIADLPQVAMNAAGDFAVIWQTSATGQSTQVHARVFGADGTPLAAEFRVDDDSHPLLVVDPSTATPAYSVALGADDHILAAWTAKASTVQGLLNQDRSNMGLFVRRFSAAGAPLDAAAHNINQSLDLLTELSSPTVAIAEDGHGLAVWAASGEECTLVPPGAVGCIVDLQPLSQRFRLLDATGAPKSPQTTVLSSTVLSQGIAARQQAAMNPAGSFVLAWQAASLQDQIHSQSFTPLGLPRLPARADFAGATGNDFSPATAIDAQGDYVIAFRAQIRVYVTDRLGGVQPLGSAFTAPIDNLVAAAMDAGNGFAVVGTFWSSANPTYGVFAQLYSFAP